MSPNLTDLCDRTFSFDHFSIYVCGWVCECLCALFGNCLTHSKSKNLPFNWTLCVCSSQRHRTEYQTIRGKENKHQSRMIHTLTHWSVIHKQILARTWGSRAMTVPLQFLFHKTFCYLLMRTFRKGENNHSSPQISVDK